MTAVPSSGAATSDRTRRAEPIVGRYIVVFERGVSRPRMTTDSLERRHGFKSEQRFAHALRGFTARLTPRQLEQIRRHPLVDLVVPDRVVRASSTVPLASGDSVPPGVRRVGAASTSAVRPASSVSVAVLDSGIDLDHPDLNAVDGKNCVGAGAAVDDNGHGTHVAGTIGARNDGYGVTGVAPGTRLVSVKVLDATGLGSWSSIICGLDWVTATLADSDPSNDIRVVNMSLGGSGPPVGACATTSDALHRAVCRATEAGAVLVVAAGNQSWDFDYPAVPDVPAAYPEVLTVTAMSDTDGQPGGAGGTTSCSSLDRDDQYASYSNFAATAAGEAHTIAAPGTCILSTVPGGYGVSSGTSMTTPHVAGVVALCMSEGASARPCSKLGPREVIARVREDARLRAASTPGYGFVGDTDRPVSGARFGRLTWLPPLTAPAVVLSPNSAILQSGSPGGGDASSLGADDEIFFKVASTTSGTRTAAWIASFQVVPNEAKSLRLTFRGASSSSCSHTLSIWRWNTNSWTSVDSRTLGTSEVPIDKLVGGSPTDYVAGASGSGEVRVRARCTRSSRFVTRTDLLQLHYQS